MTRDYCKDWTAIDAIREMVQNALDSNKVCGFAVDAECVTVVTKAATLPNSAFALGESQKATGSIGGYGEGFKIGMLVLTRLGLEPVIATADKLARGKFVKNEFTKLDTFNIELVEMAPFDSGSDIVFECNVGNIDIEELKSKITPFRDKPFKLPATVDILHNEQGKLFVNGLYICEDSKLTFGYNFAPDQITLNRDRNMTGGITWKLGQYFAKLPVKHAELIFNLIEKEAKDISDLSYFLGGNNELKAELARLFFNKYGEGATISKPGTSYVGSSYGVSTGTYASRCYAAVGIKESKKVADPDAPHCVLERFKDSNKKKLRRDVKVDLDKLITRAKSWAKPGLY